MNTLFSDGCNISVYRTFVGGSGEIASAEGLHGSRDSTVQTGHVENVQGTIGKIQMWRGHATSNQPENNIKHSFRMEHYILYCNLEFQSNLKVCPHS